MDLAIGVVAPVAVYALYRSGRADRFIVRLFWLGFVIGLAWEVPMQLANEVFDSPVHTYTQAPPVHFIFIIMSHSSWDGMLFLMGVGLMRLACGGPVLAKFRPCELLVFMAWGQVSALWVELTSIFGGAWAYIPKPWNPRLFTFNGQPITLLPQLIWLVAPAVFYLMALRARPSRPAQ